MGIPKKISNKMRRFRSTYDRKIPGHHDKYENFVVPIEHIVEIKHASKGKAEEAEHLLTIKYQMPGSEPKDVTMIIDNRDCGTKKFVRTLAEWLQVQSKAPIVRTCSKL